MPALRLLAVAVVCTGVVFQEYVKGGLPVVTLAAAEPLLPPLQETLFCVVETLIAVEEALMVNVCTTGMLHDAASVTLTVYVPGQRPVMDCVVALLLHK